MKEKIAIAIGILLLVGGAFGAVVVYQNAESGSNFLSVMGGGLVTENLSQKSGPVRGAGYPGDSRLPARLEGSVREGPVGQVAGPEGDGGAEPLGLRLLAGAG